MEEKYLTCPYCLQNISVLIDSGSDGRSEVVDDCEVCCRPIEITYSVEDGFVTLISYNPIDGNSF